LYFYGTLIFSADKLYSIVGNQKWEIAEHESASFMITAILIATGRGKSLILR